MVRATTVNFSVRELAPPGSPTGAEEGKMRVDGAPTLYPLCSVVTCLPQPLLQWPMATEHLLPDCLASFALEQVAGSGCSQLSIGPLHSLWWVCPYSLLWKWKEQALGGICSCSSAEGCTWEGGREEWRPASLAFLLLMEKGRLSEGGFNHPLCCSFLFQIITPPPV